MTVYAIGDVQGCFQELKQLLDLIQFQPERDTLWFTGDLVNRGPDSLAVLRFVKALGDRHQTVLGNHDLHLLAVAHGVSSLRAGDTLQTILEAPDCQELLDWLRQRPLLYHDAASGFVMTHAGLAPVWDLQTAGLLAREVETALRGASPAVFLKAMYGSQPDQWDSTLTGMDRLRCITNYLTRMRYCYASGRLDLAYKGAIANKPAELMPWFDVPGRANLMLNIVFGHWAALGGKADVAHVYPLDTGCVWGGALTALRLSDCQRFELACVRRI